ncbi:MAG: glycoside hydrolase [Ruminococcus sp.]|nr:glycoside hydrolase [Ruminococcus sp.]
MVKRSFAGFLAGICAISNAALVPSSGASAEGSESYSMKVSVDLTAEKKDISPYIYGVNAFDSSSVKNVTVNAIRQGGNRFTGYNWETNWSNAGEDWHNSSDTNQGDSTEGPAAAPRKFSQIGVKNKIAYKLATLQMAGYVAADKAGDVTADQTAPSSRWNKVEFKKEGDLSLEPDLTDGVVYMDEFVNYLVQKLGGAKTDAGIQAYSLDNEPVLWNDTHPYLHPDEVSSTELIGKSIELAKVVKDVDPDAEIFGPAFWGMLPCMNCGDGSEIKDKATGAVTGKYTDEEWTAVKSNYTWFVDYYLEQMKKAETESGKRLLDVFDVHYYSQGINSNDDILQAARSLYDPTYVENSWLQPWGAAYFPFLTRLQESIEKYYPGTKLAVSEYNLGNIANEKVTGKDIRTGIAEAEALGAFALNNVYFATYWGTLSECPFVESAINLYTNYDGKGSAFGNKLVSTSTEDLSLAAAFASIDDDDTSKVKVVLSNKDLTKTQKAEIAISGGASDYKSAVVYAITSDHSDIRVIDVQNDLSGDKIEVELPPLSVAQIVISDKATDEKLYEAPNITTKEVKFVFDDLEKSVNGLPMIPIEDVTALKKIIINTTASCTSGATWYGGGGGLCFNKLVTADGVSHWGSKSFSYGGGTADNVVVFDGTFTIPIDETTNLEDEPATVKDTYIEFQDWWKSSTNDNKGADVSVTYNYITMVYEFEGAQDPTDPSSGSSEDDVVYGDANCDGDVNMADAVLIMQAVTNPDKYGEGRPDGITAKGVKNGDVKNTGDGVTNKDALAIQQYKLGIIPKLPA